MKIVLNTALTRIDGKTPLKNQDGETATLGNVIIDNLLAQGYRENKIGEWSKGECYKMAERIQKAGDEVELDARERTQILLLCEAFSSALVYGQIEKILNE